MTGVGRLAGGHRLGSLKDAMIESGMDPEEPHQGPGVYFILAIPDRFSLMAPDRVKIGHSDDVRSRLAHLQTGNPAHLHLAHAIYEPDAGRRRAIEADLHHRFRHLWVNGEWFRYTNERAGGVRQLTVQRRVQPVIGHLIRGLVELPLRLWAVEALQDDR